MAQETAKLFAAQGDAFFLVARNEDKIEAVSQDLLTRGASQVYSFVTDLNDFEQHPVLIGLANESLNGINTVLIAHGTQSNQAECEASYALTEQEFRTNFLSVVSLLTPLANQFEAQGYGTIAVISSVAGDRGRQSLYVYGTSKAALSAFLQGLRNRLHKAGVQVITIKPGPTSTPLTAHLKQGLLFAEPSVIGKGIYEAIEKQKDVVYLPWFWWGIMAIIKAIPEKVFKRLSL